MCDESSKVFDLLPPKLPVLKFLEWKPFKSIIFWLIYCTISHLLCRSYVYFYKHQTNIFFPFTKTKIKWLFYYFFRSTAEGWTFHIFFDPLLKVELSIFSKLVISATCWHRVILSSTKKNFKVSRILQNIWNVCLYSMNYYLIFLGIQTDSKIFNLFNLFISKLFFVATQYLFSSETEERNMINNIKQNLHKILKLPSHIRTSWAL